MKSICFIYRHPIKEFFSIEKVFHAVINGLKDKYRITQAYAPHTGFNPLTLVKNLIFVRKLRADIYHVTGDMHYLVLGLPKQRTILTIHDCVFMNQATGLKRKVLKSIFLDLPVKNCRLVTTISEATKADIIKYTGCSNDKVVVIPNPISETIGYHPKQNSKNVPVLLFIGTTENKNLVRTIEALKGLDCLLHVIGKVPEPVKDLLDHQLNWKNSMYLSETELSAAYSEADLVLFPSLFEGFGLPIIEAQKAGRPVVTSNLSPMTQTAGEGACLVDPYDTASIRDGVLRVLRDNEYASDLVTAGLKNVMKYEPAAVSAAYNQVYESI